MDVRGYAAGQNKKSKNKRDNESGGNHKESPGKEFEVVWACNEKRGTLRRKEGDRNGSTGRRKRGRPKRRWFDKVCLQHTSILNVYMCQSGHHEVARVQVVVLVVVDQVAGVQVVVRVVVDQVVVAQVVDQFKWR